MNPIITLFCEGKKESLDYRLLNLLSSTRSSYLEPAGGKTALNAFMQGFFSEPKITALEYARAFRDRDFDYLVPDAPVLIQDKRFLISYRTTIENYLLHPNTLFDYVHTSQKAISIRERISSVSVCEELFREVCAELRFYSAARWAHGLTKRGSVDNFNFKSDWPYNSGNLPATIGDTDCRIILSDIIDNIKIKASHLNFGGFEKQYAEFVSKFDTHFTDNISICLTWFNGKDITNLIHRKLGGNSFFLNGQKGDYYDFALGDIYFGKSLRNNEFPDLTQLQEIINGNTPIEPIKLTT